MPPTAARGRGGRPWRRTAAYIRRTQHTCHICGNQIDKTLPAGHPMSFTVDHVQPLAHAPELALDKTNLKAAHHSCNSSKGAGTTPAHIEPSETW